jgi:hypothetical protein
MSSPLDSPMSFITPTRPSFAQFSNASLVRTSCESCESVVCPSEGCVEIDVSPAFFDDMPAPEGPATASCLHRPEYRLPSSSLMYLEPVHTRSDMRPRGMSTRSAGAGHGHPVAVDPNHSVRSRSSVKGPSEYGPTAGFIPNGYSDNSTTSLCEIARSLRSQKSECYFDFDALPPNKVGHHHHHHRRDSIGGEDGTSVPMGHVNGSVLPSPGVAADPTTLGGVGHLFGRAQYKCNQPTSAAVSSRYPSCDKSSFSDTSSTDQPRRRFGFFTMLIPSFTAGVPAFATPLTEVQSPEVKRAQWEVVIRAGFVGAVIAGTVTGIIVGVVP